VIEQNQRVVLLAILSPLIIAIVAALRPHVQTPASPEANVPAIVAAEIVEKVSEIDEPETSQNAPPETKLALTDLAMQPTHSGEYLAIGGHVRCLSAEPVTSTYFEVYFFSEKSGTLIRSIQGSVRPHTLDPGELGSFSAIVEPDVRRARIKLKFEDLADEIPWVDWSGNNAHQ
jgi:hypothetical protein